MKQLEIEVNGYRYLLVEVPNDATEFELVTNQSTMPYTKSLSYEDPIPFRGYRNYCGVDLPEGNYTLLGDTNDEDVCRGVVEHNEKTGFYMAYNSDMGFIWNSATESMASLLRVKGVHRVNTMPNPINVDHESTEHFDDCRTSWQQAQDNLWTGKILILKID